MRAGGERDPEAKGRQPRSEVLHRGPDRLEGHNGGQPPEVPVERLPVVQQHFEGPVPRSKAAIHRLPLAN